MIGARAAATAGRPGEVRGDARPWSRRAAWAWGAGRLRRAGAEAAAGAIDAEVLLRHAAGISREELLARPESRLEGRASAAYAELIMRRAGGAPVAYLVGRREFYGIDLVVDRRVLIPRPETEHLVDVVAAALRNRVAPIAVEIGTGSGAVAIALARAVPGARVVATDVSGPALDLARVNAARAGVAHRITWAQGPALAPLDRALGGRRVDAIASNPPYIPTSEIATLSEEIRAHEPIVALDGGADGLAVHRAIVGGAARHLALGGVLALEVAAGWDQAGTVAALIAAAGRYSAPRLVRDYAGVERIVAATRMHDGYHRR